MVGEHKRTRELHLRIETLHKVGGGGWFGSTSARGSCTRVSRHCTRWGGGMVGEHKGMWELHSRIQTLHNVGGRGGASADK